MIKNLSANAKRDTGSVLGSSGVMVILVIINSHTGTFAIVFVLI